MLLWKRYNVLTIHESLNSLVYIIIELLQHQNDLIIAFVWNNWSDCIDLKGEKRTTVPYRFIILPETRYLSTNACSHKCMLHTWHTHKYTKDICMKQHPSSLYLAHANNENYLFKRPNRSLLASKPRSKPYPLSHSGKTSLNKQTEFGLMLLLLSIPFAGDLKRHITYTNLWSTRLLQWGCCMALLHWSYEQWLLDIWKTAVCIRIVTG